MGNIQSKIDQSNYSIDVLLKICLFWSRNTATLELFQISENQLADFRNKLREGINSEIVLFYWISVTKYVKIYLVLQHIIVD